jgi:phosphoribosylamine--glycine ligase
VVVVAGGYPSEYLKGKSISGMENVRGSYVFHAGTILEGDDVKTAGGRVMMVTASSENLFDALQQATADASRIYFDGAYFRKDIGFDIL